MRPLARPRRCFRPLQALLAALCAGVWLCASSAAHADDEPAAAEEDTSQDDSAKEAELAREKPTEAAPTPKSRVESRFQIGVFSTLASYTKLSFTLGSGATAQRGSVTDTAYGFSGNPVTFELGYGVSSSLVLGLLLELGTTKTTASTIGYQNAQQFGAFLVGPRVEYSFGDRVRPFVSGVAGFITVPQSGEYYSISLTGFELVGGAGVHIFLADSFSVDPMLRGSWGTGKGKVKDPLSDLPATGTLWSGAALLGVSGWI